MTKFKKLPDNPDYELAKKLGIDRIADVAFDFVIGGTVMLFVGLAGGILLFKATTSDKRRGIFLAIGFAFIAISLALIFLIQEWWKLEFIRS